MLSRMSLSDLRQQKRPSNHGRFDSADSVDPRLERGLDGRLQTVLVLTFAAIVAAIFGPALFALGIHAARSDVHSHILLIPLISGYLIYLRREQIPKKYGRS